MAWNYSGNPITSTADGRRDSVRLLIGDTDTTDQQLQDEEIAFCLGQANDDVYGAASIAARTLSAKYSRLVDTSIESVSASYSQRADSYLKLAIRMDKMSKKHGKTGLGVPVAGGISISTMESVEDDTDRVEPSFKRDQFRNPSNYKDDDDRYR